MQHKTTWVCLDTIGGFPSTFLIPQKDFPSEQPSTTIQKSINNTQAVTLCVAEPALGSLANRNARTREPARCLCIQTCQRLLQRSQLGPNSVAVRTKTESQAASVIGGSPSCSDEPQSKPAALFNWKREGIPFAFQTGLFPYVEARIPIATPIGLFFVACFWRQYPVCWAADMPVP